MRAIRSKSQTVELGPEAEIPERTYFRIGEVARLVGVQPHVLRYWEKEVAAIRPGKSSSNQRRYRRRDIELFREIKRLLYQERYTLAGARQRLFPRRGAGGLDPTEQAEGQEPPQAAATHEELSEGLTPEAPAADPVDHSPPPDTEPPRRQLALGFAVAPVDERLQRVRAGLRELIRFVGEEP